jgi:hypothetical protein
MATNMKIAVLVSRLHNLIIILCVLTSCTVAEKGEHWKSVAMADGSLEIRYEPAYLYGPHTIFFYFDRTGEFQFLKATKLRNDGVNLRDKNIEIKSLENQIWRITLKGEEQMDENWLVKVGASNVTMTQVE